MTWRSTCSPLPSPMFDFAIKSNETISWINIFSHRLSVKVATQKITHFTVTSHEVTQIILKISKSNKYN